MRKKLSAPRSFLRAAGYHYWTASLLPALLGTSLPFWLHPRGYTFNWPGAIEFLAVVILAHAGFTFLQARFEDMPAAGWTANSLSGAGLLCLAAACLLGLYLNRFFNGMIFLVFGSTTLFIGVLYVTPPFSFYRRAGGEIVLSEGLGLLPVLGAYLVQTGDLTRTVYLAALPLVALTGLWVWTDELITRTDDEKSGRRTMVRMFGERLSARAGVPALVILFYASVVVAVLTASLSPLALVALISFRMAARIVRIAWKASNDPVNLLVARRNAFALHLVTGILLAAVSLLEVGNYAI